MRIIYDDLVEAGEVFIRCEYTIRKNMCHYCPFYDRCTMNEFELRHVFCGEIERRAVFDGD